MMAVFSVANSAGNTNRFIGLCCARVHVIRINDGISMFNFAPKADGISANRRVVGPARFTDVSGKAEISRAIRGFSELSQELTGRFKGAVYIPKRAGPAVSCKL